MKLHSIKHRLIAAILLVELASALAITGLALAYERHARFRAFDIMLRGRADSLLGAVQDAEDAQDNVMLDGTEANLPRTDIFEVRDQNHRVLGRSPNWSGIEPATPLDPARPFQLTVDATRYRILQLDGVRIVDPGDKGGGIPRRVTIVYGSPTAPVWNAIWEAVAFYGLISLLLLAVSAAIMLWLLNRGLAPLHELALETEKVSATSWQFAPSSAVRNTTELAPVASAFEAVLQRLEHSFLQQRRFVSDAAHELKTGVAVAKSSLQLLTLKPRTIAEYHTGLERCQGDMDRMEEIVATMLTLARLEGEATQTQSAPAWTQIDAGQIIRRTTGHLAPIATLHQLDLNVSISPDASGPIEISIAEDELELLCSNLILNALQHGRAETAVNVTVNRRTAEAEEQRTAEAGKRAAAEAGNWLELRIEDHGTGIAPELLPFVFERFYRGDPSRSRCTGGTGLGLAISKAILDRSRGTIEISSAVEQGTTVLIRLPIANCSSQPG